MRATDIEDGREYVVRLGRQHVLIEGADVTYKERLDFFRKRSPFVRMQLAVEGEKERDRLQSIYEGGAVGSESLKSRLLRVEHRPADPERSWKQLHSHVTFDARATVVARVEDGFIVEAMYAERKPEPHPIFGAGEHEPGGVLRARVKASNILAPWGS